MAHAVPSLHAVVRGRVQGVFFRASARDEAGRLGLGGWVRNHPEGTVEVYAVGPEPKLQELLRWLRHGPPSARVEGVDASWGSDASPPAAFRIRS